MFSGIIKKSQILPSEALSFGQMLPEGCYPDLDWCEFFRWGACGGEGKCALVTISSEPPLSIPPILLTTILPLRQPFKQSKKLAW